MEISKEELISKLDFTVQLLYQNKEKRSIEAVAELLVLFSSYLESLLRENRNIEAQTFLVAVKELVAQYNATDMIGMADCIKGEVMPFIQQNY